MASGPSSTHLRHHRAIFAVMHSGVFRNGVVMSGPKPEEKASMRRRTFISLLGGAAACATRGAGTAAGDAADWFY
jgi:hypothetical protein